MKTQNHEDKVVALPELKAAIAQLRAGDKSVVLITGCFDITHPGHAVYFRDAAELGDVLVIGINSDDSVQALKGPTRPICNELPRALVVAAVGYVDLVVVFDNDEELIAKLEPDVYGWSDTSVKAVDDYPERMELLQRLGTEIIRIPTPKIASTTNIIERVLAATAAEAVSS